MFSLLPLKAVTYQAFHVFEVSKNSPHLCVLLAKATDAMQRQKIIRGSIINVQSATLLELTQAINSNYYSETVRPRQICTQEDRLAVSN